jgi:hypothetical protein
VLLGRGAALHWWFGTDDETSYAVSRMSCGAWRKVGNGCWHCWMCVSLAGEKAGATTDGVCRWDKEARRAIVFPSTRHPLSGFVENRRRDGAGPDLNNAENPSVVFVS